MYTHKHPDEGDKFSPADLNFVRVLNVQRFREVAIEDGKRVTYELTRTGNPGHLSDSVYNKRAKEVASGPGYQADMNAANSYWYSSASWPAMAVTTTPEP